MSDRWRMFPATMGEDQAFISFNDSFAERANADPRARCLRVEAAIKDPTEAGMPQGDEFKALAKLDDALDSALTQLGAAYVGRITVAARRYFYFYLDAPESEARKTAAAAAAPLGYALRFVCSDDPHKTRFWKDLYPTADDWRVIHDMEVLDALAQAGDDADVSRTVRHWAYFDAETSARAFREWLETQHFCFEEQHENASGRICVTFTHEGLMHLAEITDRTIRCRRTAEALGGSYDGWETSIEKG